MKRKSVSVLTALCLLCIALSATACGHTHNYVETVVPPACDRGGYTLYECAGCGKTKVTDLTDPLSPTREHTLGEWETAKASTATEAGEEKLSCKVCGYFAMRGIPASNECTVTFKTNNARASLEGQLVQTVKIGGTTTPVTVKVKSGYKFVGWSNGETKKTVSVTPEADTEMTAIVEPDVAALNLPVVYVETENAAEIKDKENYVPCGVSILNSEKEYCFDSASAGIRLRGNSTMTYPKKPYRIKFDKKTSLFGWDKNKSWVLLALYMDFSNIKDHAAFSISAAVNQTMYSPHSKHVELYLNGEYMGLYLLTEQTDENAGRTGVKEDFTETDTEVPFLVEWDDYAPNEGAEGVDYFKIVNSDTNVTSYYNVKYPEQDEPRTQAQFDYLKNYVTTVNTLCHDDSTTRAELEKYVDVDTFIDYYLVQELMGQMEIDKKSVFMSKTKTGKLVMGPVWDFDWSAGGPMTYQNGMREPNVGLMSSTNWFARMLKKPWFRQAVLNRLDEIKTTVRAELTKLRAYKKELAPAARKNAKIWDFAADDPQIYPFDTYYDWVIDYIDKRIDLIPIFLQYI